jgi:hypothetical protein
MTTTKDPRKPVANPYQLIALDVDGTLLNEEGDVTPGTKATLQQLTSQGVHVALATGRRYIIANFLPPLLEIPLHMILSNGAVIRDHTAAITYESYLPSAWAWQAVEEARRLNLQSTIYENGSAGDRMLFDGDWRVHQSPQSQIKRRPELESLFVDLTTVTDLPDPIEIVLWGEEDEMRNLADALKATGLDYTLVLWRGRESSSFVRDGRSALEILGPNTSKATALDWLCAHLGIQPSGVVAFGDDVNDVEMLEFAGLGVAVGNATQAARDAADIYTHNDDDEGVARTLRDFFAIE